MKIVRTSGHGASSARWILAVVMGVSLSGLGPMATAKAPKPLAAISVEFSADCVTAEVMSDKPVKGVSAVMANGSWHKMKGLKPAPSYLFMADPKGANAGQPIQVVYVRAGPFKQRDALGVIPGLVGMNFACTPG